MPETKDLDAAQGVQSLEVGLQIFGLLAGMHRACGVSDLARAAGMHRAKAYRYLVSLRRAGWVDQDTSGLYRVGPAVRELALTWWSDQGVLRQAMDAAQQLCSAHGATCFVSLWRPGGATAARVCQPDRLVAIAISEGVVLPPDTSATGRLFAVLRGEAAGVVSAADQQAIRATGLSVVQGAHVAGVNAIAAPVLDAQGQIALALTLVAPAPMLDTAPEAAPTQALRAACERLTALRSA